MNRPAVIAVVLLSSVCAARPACAQTAPPPPPPAREGSVEAAFVGTTGNASTSTLGLRGEFIARPTGWLLRTRASLVRSETQHTLTAKSAALEQRAERSLNKRLSAFGAYEFFRDRFAGVSNRHAVTGGLAFKAINAAQHILTVDAGGGYLNERRLAGANVSSAAYAAGSDYRWKLSKTSEFHDELRLLGTTSPAGNWTVAHAASVSAALTTLLSLKFSTGVRFVHQPPPGFQRADTTTSVALVATFPRK